MPLGDLAWQRFPCSHCPRPLHVGDEPVAVLMPHKSDNNIWYFDTEVYQMEGIGRFYLGLANHIKILQAPELEQYVAAFVKENLQK